MMYLRFGETDLVCHRIASFNNGLRFSRQFARGNTFPVRVLRGSGHFASHNLSQQALLPRVVREADPVQYIVPQSLRAKEESRARSHTPTRGGTTSEIDPKLSTRWRPTCEAQIEIYEQC